MIDRNICIQDVSIQQDLDRAALNAGKWEETSGFLTLFDESSRIIRGVIHSHNPRLISPQNIKDEEILVLQLFISEQKQGVNVSVMVDGSMPYDLQEPSFFVSLNKLPRRLWNDYLDTKESQTTRSLRGRDKIDAGDKEEMASVLHNELGAAIERMLTGKGIVFEGDDNHDFGREILNMIIWQEEIMAKIQGREPFGMLNTVVRTNDLPDFRP